jgi:uncharacterized protein YkwD
MKNSLTNHFLKASLALALSLIGFGASANGAVNAQEQALFNLMKNDGGQNRPFVTLDPILCEVARAKAQDMGNRGYFDHTTPDGETPNSLVRKAGYQLPANYPASGNNVESCSAGRSSAGDTWGSLLDSSAHAQHLLAQNSFYSTQTSVGIGYANVPGSDYTHYWCIITAPPSGPKVRFSAPANNSEVGASQVTVSGTTSGNPDAASVQVRVGGGEWITASGTENWTATVSGLIAGANIIDARSLKADGTVLDDATRTVRYTVQAFVDGAGRHAGVFTGSKSGLVKINLTSTGLFTAKVKSAGQVLTFSGTLDAAGNASVTASGVTLSLSYAQGNLSGSLIGAGFNSDIALDALVPATTTSTALAGKYTVILPAAEGASANVPQGDGVAVVTVASNGVAKITGTLANGSAFTASSPLTKSGELPVFANGGLLAGSLTFNSTSSSDLSGALLWSTASFSTNIQAVGSRYVAPAAGNRVVNVTSASNNTSLGLGAGGLAAPVVQTVTLGTDNSVVLSAPAVEGLTLTVNAANGRFSGKFIHPQTGALTKIRGAILQKQNAGFGFFTGGGYATFTAAQQ